MKVVVTGNKKGIGKYLYEEIAKQHEVFGINRDTNLSWDNISSTDVLIHCAFNSIHQVSDKTLYNYLKDNLFLTDVLVNYHNLNTKFIYFSSVQVYPDDNLYHNEEETIDLDKISGTYGKVKLMAESIIKENVKNHLILRLPSIIGEYMRINSLVKAVTGEPQLVLTADSTNNYVGYADVKNFIEFAIDNDLRGTYNFVSNSYLEMSNICEMFGNYPTFGTHRYNPPLASNAKISPYYNKSSEQVVKEWAEKYSA